MFPLPIQELKGIRKPKLQQFVQYRYRLKGYSLWTVYLFVHKLTYRIQQLEAPFSLSFNQPRKMPKT